MKVELHLIQNFAPSCLNRDENNMPKDCVFGGARRARISSQCLKRSVRQYWNDRPDIQRGFRTKRIKTEIAKAVLAKRAIDDEALVAGVVNLFVNAYYSKPDGKRPDQTAVLLYMGQAEVDEAARCVDELWDDLAAIVHHNAAEQAKDAKKAKLKELAPTKDIKARLLGVAPSADIALFGRMLAKNADMNTDAACQVAHAISTHAVDAEMDFFTAVDDLNPDEDTGAGMMGVTGFNSACFYRYACIDRDELIGNLGGDAARADAAIRAFLTASILALPTGKQNSMAAQNRPDFGMAVVRKTGVPMSLANAFSRPVAKMAPEGLVVRSIAELAQYWGGVTGFYGLEGVEATPVFTTGDAAPLGSLAGCRVNTMDEFLEAVMAGIAAAEAGA